MRVIYSILQRNVKIDFGAVHFNIIFRFRIFVNLETSG